MFTPCEKRTDLETKLLEVRLLWELFFDPRRETSTCDNHVTKFYQTYITAVVLENTPILFGHNKLRGYDLVHFFTFSNFYWLDDATKFVLH